MSSSFSYVSSAVFLKCAVLGGFPFGQLVHLLVETNGEAVLASTTTLSNAGTSSETFFRRKLHDHDVRRGK